MKPVFRVTAAALTALTLMASAINSQDAPAEDDPPMIARTYDMHGLTQGEFARARVPGSIGDVLAPERLFRDVSEPQSDQWSLRRSGHESRCWESSYGAMASLTEFCGVGENWEILQDGSETPTITLVATEAMHKRVDWALQQVRNIAQIRVNLRVHRLKEGVVVEGSAFDKAGTSRLAAQSRLVGAVTTGLGDPVVLQQTDTTTFVADYDAALSAEASVHVPVTGTLVTGQELVAGAIVLADGRVWVQGWHAERKLEEMRKVTTCAGAVELPKVSYRYTPISTVIDNGGAALLDAGPAGRFVVSVTASGTVADSRLDIGQGRELRLLNAAGALRGSDMGARWLMTPNSQTFLDDSGLQQILFEEYVDGPYNDAAIYLTESAQGCEGVELKVVGPLLGVFVDSPADVDADSLANRKQYLQHLADDMAPGANLSLRLRVVRVPANSALPTGLLEGRPSPLDLAELDSVAGRMIVADRLSSCGLEQNMDLLDTRICSHVQGYDVSTATGAAIHDPRIAALLLGTQLRWVARDAGAGGVTLDLRAGLTVGPDQFEPAEVLLGKTAYTIERSRSNLVQARFSGALKAGESMSYIVPATAKEEELVVFVVSRIK